MCFVVGTFGWMAPEVRHDSEGHSTYNRSADVFSLGLLYLALVLHQLGRNLLPFTGKQTFITLAHAWPLFDCSVSQHSRAQYHSNHAFVY